MSWEKLKCPVELSSAAELVIIPLRNVHFYVVCSQFIPELRSLGYFILGTFKSKQPIGKIDLKK